LVQLKLEGLRQMLDEMMPRVKQVMKQTRARIHRGDTRSEDKLLSVFEPSTEIIRKGKSGKPTRGLAEIGACGDNYDERQHDSKGGRGLQPTGIVAAAFVWHMLGDVGDGAAVLAA
jgi:hypothetical protein